MAYLCEFHRRQLQQYPQAAARRWQQWMQLGGDYFHRGDWQRAGTYLGSAYETGQLLLNTQPERFAEGDLNGFDQMMIAGHYLAECLRHQQRNADEWQVLSSVHQRLLNAVEDNTVAQPIRARLRHNLAISLQLLDRHCQRHKAGGVFAALYQRTMARLQYCAAAISH